MQEDEKWALFHDYARAVVDEKIDPLLCPNDGMQLYIRSDKEYNPVLYCYYCDIYTHLGLRKLQKIQKLLKEIPVD